MDIVLEALKRYRENQQFKIKELLKYAAVCRVEKVLKEHIYLRTEFNNSFDLLSYSVRLVTVYAVKGEP